MEAFTVTGKGLRKTLGRGLWGEIERRRQRGRGGQGEAREKRTYLRRVTREGATMGDIKQEGRGHTLEMMNPMRETTRPPRTQRFREPHPLPSTPHAFRLCHEP